MSDNKSSSLGMLGGLIVGAAIGAGAAILFGTEKGKKIRQDLQKKYPQFLDTVENIIEGVEVRQENQELPKLEKPKKRKL